jgi:hypothetical protein
MATKEKSKDEAAKELRDLKEAKQEKATTAKVLSRNKRKPLL